MTTERIPLLLDAKTAAQILDPTMSPETLLRMARANEIDSQKRGRLVRFTMQNLNDYVAKTKRRESSPYRVVTPRKPRK